MSTRANVVVKDKYGEVWFYRHSDGYPDGTLPTLRRFLGWVKEGKIRGNTSQSAGWLVLIGAEEYREHTRYTDGKFKRCKRRHSKLFTPEDDGAGRGWKVGAYEPTSKMHGDIEYLYEIDLTVPEIRVFECGHDNDYNATKDTQIDTIR
jgi:hypothetical protein